MSAHYQELLDAAIRHLEQLKANGVRFVPASSAALNALAKSPPARLQSTPAVSTRVGSAVSIRPQPIAVRNRSPVEIPTNRPSPTVAKAAPEIAPLSSAPTSGVKALAMEDLRQRAMICVQCPHLAASRKNVVFGVGDINSPLMFVGEAPGAEEDEQAEPFVGRAGQLLTRIVTAMGLSRQTVYIANILKCRPDTPGETSGNRKPTPQEMETCIPYLHQQIDLIQPKVIVALGGTAVDGLLGKTVGITQLRGRWKTYRNIPLMPTFHPSYLLRPGNEAQKRKVWEDMLQVMERLALPITEKQRSFFLKPTP